jgi:membrane protein DedA with SNARE-associated domain|tara:strand:+ start:4949 stop:5572 length:624 start_codon:yes stop_codon:yes gene_type:complete
MSFINPDFILNLGTTNILILLIIFSFTNGLFLLPASQVILIIGGLIISLNNLNFFIVFAILVLSNFLGNYILYFISFKWGEKTARKILPIRKKTLDNHILVINYLFKKYGSYIIFIGRNLLVLHSLVSIPAGVAKVSKRKYTLYTLLGISTWSLLFMWIGIILGNNYEYFLEKFNIIGSTITIIILIIIYYFFNVYMKKILILAKKR